MSALKVDLVQGSPEWHSWRENGVGASDVPALFNKSPYKTKRDLFFEKAGYGTHNDEDRSYIYQKGHEAEIEIRELFSKHTKIELSPACFERDIIFRASLDGYDKSQGILEAKLVGKEVLKKALDGEIPEHHRIQIQSQLYTSDSDKAFWGARAPKVSGGVVVEIGRDEKLIAQIKVEVEMFWERLQKNQIPELSPQDTLFLTAKNQVSTFQRLKELRAQKEIIDACYAEMEKIAKSFATHPKVMCEGVLVTEVERSGAIDYLKIPEIAALEKEYLEQFRKKSSVYKMIRFGKEG